MSLTGEGEENSQSQLRSNLPSYWASPTVQVPQEVCPDRLHNPDFPANFPHPQSKLRTSCSMCNPHHPSESHGSTILPVHIPQSMHAPCSRKHERKSQSKLDHSSVRLSLKYPQRSTRLPAITVPLLLCTFYQSVQSSRSVSVKRVCV